METLISIRDDPQNPTREPKNGRNRKESSGTYFSWEMTRCRICSQMNEDQIYLKIWGLSIQNMGFILYRYIATGTFHHVLHVAGVHQNMDINHQNMRIESRKSQDPLKEKFSGFLHHKTLDLRCSDCLENLLEIQHIVIIKNNVPSGKLT